MQVLWVLGKRGLTDRLRHAKCTANIGRSHFELFMDCYRARDILPTVRGVIRMRMCVCTSTGSRMADVHPLGLKKCSRVVGVLLYEV